MSESFDGLARSDLRRRLNLNGLEIRDAVTSTLDVVHGLVSTGDLVPPALVVAESQTSGRGRRGGRWESEPGKGLWLAFLLAGEPHGGLLSIRCGMAVVEALRELGAAATLKWPNDVMIEDRKVAGVLCEPVDGRKNDAAMVAVGIGINVVGPVPNAVVTTAAALDQHVAGVRRLDVLTGVTGRVIAVRSAPRLTQAELATIDRNDWLRGRRVRSPLAGQASGIAADGALMIDDEVGHRQAAYGGTVALA